MTMKLIVALDIHNKSDALHLVERLDPTQCALKVGSEMFTLLGPDFVRSLVDKGFKIFLDLKFHDIPNTVARACQSAAELGVWMLNVHAAGGMDMMQAAKNALEPYGQERPLLIAVTVLTSMKEATLPTIGINNSLNEQVITLAKLAKAAGLDGVVSSAWEASMIKAACRDNFLTVTPGIRLPTDNQDDQSRIMTPVQAIQAGSDYLVVGRPITKSQQPVDTINELLKTIHGIEQR